MRKSWPMWLGLVLGFAALAWGLLLVDGTLAWKWQHAARYTARVGFPLLILAYVARPLVDLTRSDWSRALLARRKWLGLGFAISHTIHLATLAMANSLAGTVPAIITLVGGGGAYFMLYVMAFTSNRRAMKKLGKWWKPIHRFGIHYLWFIFAQSYIGRIFNPELRAQGIIFGSIAIAAAAIRFAAWQKSRRRRAVAA